MKKIQTHFLFILTLLTGANKLQAQHQEINEKPQVWKTDSNSQSVGKSLLQAFRKGQTSGHFRYFFMHTDNEMGLTDYYAHAAGGGLRFETAMMYRLQFAVSGFYIFNIASADLSKPDPATGQMSRYELGLFDVENPHNKKDLDRLEELYIKYSAKNLHLIFGKQLLNTPFINLQDGRMRPTGVEGLYGDWKMSKKVKVEGGLLYAISPRSTTKYYHIGESIGIYSGGVNPDGKKSGYPGQLDSRYVAQLGIRSTPAKGLDAQLWQMHVDQLLHTSMIQLDGQHQFRKKYALKVGLQSIQQFTVGDGGNVNPALAYAVKGNRAFTLGASIGFSSPRSAVSLNYNRITAHGRYLMPREWGRDPFYTFMARERNEGQGDLHAIVVKYAYTEPKTRLKAAIAAGHIKTADVKNFALNKYGLPSYLQANAELKYAFRGFLKGLESQVLLVAKMGTGNNYGEARYVINKNQMMLYNVVLNYYF